MSDALPSLLLHPDEEQLDRTVFDETLLRTVIASLKCSDGSGRQKCAIPQHVAEALAARFASGGRAATA